MIATLRFNLSDESDKYNYDDCMKASNYRRALEEIRSELFRPIRKHGYSNPILAKALEDKVDVHEWMSLLEDAFNEILAECEVTEI